MWWVVDVGGFCFFQSRRRVVLLCKIRLRRNPSFLQAARLHGFVTVPVSSVNLVTIPKTRPKSSSMLSCSPKRRVLFQRVY